MATGTPHSELGGVGLLQPDPSLVLPDANLIIPGLPGELRVVPNKEDGLPDWPGRWWKWHDYTLSYREDWHAELKGKPSLWEQEIDLVSRMPSSYMMAMHLNVWEPQPGQPLGHGLLPAIPIPFQVKIGDFLDARYAAAMRGDFAHALLEKPRAVGATYAVDAWVFRKLKFDVPCDIGMMSRTEDDVDKRDRKGSLFGKLDVFYENLDPRLHFKGFRRHRHRTHMFFQNPETGGQVFGEATTKQAFRGDRGTVMIGDEVAFWDGLADIVATLFGATPMVVLLSSKSDEVSRDFSEIIENFQDQFPEALLSVDDDERPDRQDEWGSKTEKAYAVLGQVGKDAYQREHKKQADVGVSKYIYPEAMDIPLGALPIDPRKTTLVGLDPGSDDDFAVVLFQERDELCPGTGLPWVDLVWGWQAKGKDAPFIASLLLGKPLTGGGQGSYFYDDGDLLFAAIMGKLGLIEWYGCIGGTQRGSKESWYKEIDIAAQLQAHRRIAVRTSFKDKDRHLPGKRDALKSLMKRMRCLDHPVPIMVRRAFRENQYQKRSRNRPGVTEAWQDEHDWTAHFIDAAEAVAVHVRMLHDVRGAIAAQQKPSYANPHGIEAVMPSVPSVPRAW